MLELFAARGGMVVAGPSWSGAAPAADPHEVRKTGTGRLVVYKNAEPDPETLSKDLLSLLGRGNLGVRLFNASSVLLPPVSRILGGGCWYS